MGVGVAEISATALSLERFCSREKQSPGLRTKEPRRRGGPDLPEERGLGGVVAGEDEGRIWRTWRTGEEEVVAAPERRKRRICGGEGTCAGSMEDEGTCAGVERRMENAEARPVVGVCGCSAVEKEVKPDLEERSELGGWCGKKRWWRRLAVEDEVWIWRRGAPDLEILRYGCYGGKRGGGGGLLWCGEEASS